jgi:CubicO group peptidase (beta-lactamase class C family)
MSSRLVFLSIIFIVGCGSGFQVMQTNSPPTPPAPPPNVVPIGPPLSSPNGPLDSFIKSLSVDYVGQGIVKETGQNKFPSMVLGVITPKGKSILTFGVTTKGVPPTSTDIYPISSITKMLTGLILARGLDERAFLLPKKLSELLPSDLAPLVGGRTLGQTVSHYASFKAKPMNLNYANTDAPAANYSRASLATCLASSECSATSEPIGSVYLYSDLGIGILLVLRPFNFCRFCT